LVALESGRSSWTAPLDAVRLAPGADLAAVTASQLRGVIGRLVDGGHRKPDDAEVWIVMDARLRRGAACVPARRSAGTDSRADAIGPGPAQERAASTVRDPGPAAPSRRRVHLQ
jgi:hypothetical protein